MYALASVTRNPAVRLVLALLREPERVAELDLADWDAAVRVARAARVLAVIGARLRRHGVIDRVPEPVRIHFDAEENLARFQRQMVLFELHELSHVLGPLAVRVVALKGAAYVLQRLPAAEGRLLSDVDIMVPRADIERAETSLRSAGWVPDEIHPYDEGYYRKWAHEVPPLKAPGHAFEVDLHHTILPLTSRLRPDPGALFEQAQLMAGTGFWVLRPEDQVLHACLHLFHDSDCSEKLRELVDLEGLLDAFNAVPDFWPTLVERAASHGVERPLWYGMRYASKILGAAVPTPEIFRMRGARPNTVVRSLMDWLVPDALLPHGPDALPALRTRMRRRVLFLRSHWLRMPPWLLAWHSANKSARRLSELWEERRTPSAEGP